VLAESPGAWFRKGDRRPCTAPIHSRYCHRILDSCDVVERQGHRLKALAKEPVAPVEDKM